MPEIGIRTLAKEVKLHYTDLLAICTSAGIPGKSSPLSSLTAEEVVRLRAFLATKNVLDTLPFSMTMEEVVGLRAALANERGAKPIPSATTEPQTQAEHQPLSHMPSKDKMPAAVTKAVDGTAEAPIASKLVQKWREAQHDKKTQMPDRAIFPRNLNLPDGDSNLLQDAATAVKEEYRNSIRWKRLRCRQVDDLGDNLYRLHVGHSIQFDWTWEGSTAFRPTSPAFVPDETTADLESVSAWIGDVVEVDETEGYLYVAAAVPQNPPRTGLFYVRPFEFLAQLYEIYTSREHESIRQHFPSALNACRGGVHPAMQEPVNHGLEALRPLWQHTWSIIWGPPGTGKTYTIGTQVAECLAHPAERVLVVSTTNRATDEAALNIGRALHRNQRLSAASTVLRIGKGADYEAFEKEGFQALLQEGERDLRRQVSRLQRQHDREENTDERAKLNTRIQNLRATMRDAALDSFLNPHLKAVVSTAFNAVRMLTKGEVVNSIRQGHAPFTTVIIDEAGLVSRATVAALACLAARRVVLVGDPRQLSPITKMSRVLPSEQSTWLMSSALTHLQPNAQQPNGVHILNVQHRMHSEIRSAVSKYQYGGILTDHPTVATREWEVGTYLAGHPRTIWYVLDEDTDDLPKIRAERGPGNRSWVRPYTAELLEKLFEDPLLAKSTGFFISPFAAQAIAMRQFFSQKGLSGWRSSTVHSQQGTEADIVIFDTVNAGSYGWSYDEWQRLINVGVSRAKHCCILLASRAEMQEPYLAALQPHLAPRVFRGRGGRYFWTEVPAQAVYPISMEAQNNPDSLGSQLERRKALRPVLSREQQRLCKLPVDGRPRLVRGVAGSGKSYVLAFWLCNALRVNADTHYWVLYGNSAMHKLLENMIHEAWRNVSDGQPLPANRFQLIHIMDLMDQLLRPYGKSMNDFGKYDYDAASEAYLQLCPPDRINPRCDAVFIDEAQDFGPNTLRVVVRLAKQSQQDEPSKRPVMIFYDNAQNIYARRPPTWVEVGIDVVGRSTVMEESFRSTKPITELALNVLYRFKPPESDPDHRELLARGLIEKTMRHGKEWWAVRFNHVDGPAPKVHKYPDLATEARAIGDHLVALIRKEGVKPSDIRIICLNQQVRTALQHHVPPKLADIGVTLHIATSVQRGQAFIQSPSTIVVATPNSFKGWDSEVLVLAGADYFAAGQGVLANSLYTAMTRARSVLAIYGQQNAPGHGAQIMPAIKECLDLLIEGDDTVFVSVDDLVEICGEANRGWLEGIGRKHKIVQEPFTSPSDEILFEPIFWFETPLGKYACFGAQQPSRNDCHSAEDQGFRILMPGEAYE